MVTKDHKKSKSGKSKTKHKSGSKSKHKTGSSHKSKSKSNRSKSNERKNQNHDSDFIEDILDFEDDDLNMSEGENNFDEDNDNAQDNIDAQDDDDPPNDNESQDDENEDSVSDNTKKQEKNKKAPKLKLDKNTREKLKRKITEWFDYDDKIKDVSDKLKVYKKAKKDSEDLVLKMINLLGMEENTFDVHDDKDQLRGRVYRYKSVTKKSITPDIIKNALMESIRDEKKVDQFIKKIETKRPTVERFYLKRTKGGQE